MRAYLASSASRPRYVLPAAFVLATLLALPSLSSPLLEDDVIHRAMLLDAVPGVHWGPLELYDFLGNSTRPVMMLRERGSVPWFAAEDLRLRFFRPLSSATIAIDVGLFGERTWPSRLHSLFWFFAILALVNVLHRRFLPVPTAAVATMIYTLAGGHSLPVSWIAARHTLVATSFALLAFWLHVRARDDGWRPGRFLAPLAFAAGLLAGEMALGAVAVIGAWELLARRDAVRRRLAALMPIAALTVAYGGFYVAMGYGARNSGAYLDPRDGVAGAITVARHFWILTGELVAAMPSDATGVATATVQTVAASWGAAMAIVAWTVFRLARAQADARELVAVRWMALAAAGAALPGTFAIVGGRVLTLALFPASAVMAVVLVRGFAAVRSRSLRPLSRALVAVAVAGFGFGYFITGPALRIGLGVWFTRIARVQSEQAASLPSCQGTMVVVAASDPVIATYVPATLALQHRVPERLRVLSMAPNDHRIENVTQTGFDLTTVATDRTRSIWERLYRNDPLPSGTRVTISSLDASVLEDHDGAPVRVRFDFGEPLDSPHLCFFQWRDGRIRRLAPPAPGERTDLPHQPGPMGW